MRVSLELEFLFVSLPTIRVLFSPTHHTTDLPQQARLTFPLPGSPRLKI